MQLELLNLLSATAAVNLPSEAPTDGVGFHDVLQEIGDLNLSELVDTAKLPDEPASTELLDLPQVAQVVDALKAAMKHLGDGNGLPGEAAEAEVPTVLIPQVARVQVVDLELSDLPELDVVVHEEVPIVQLPVEPVIVDAEIERSADEVVQPLRVAEDLRVAPVAEGVAVVEHQAGMSIAAIAPTTPVAETPPTTTPVAGEGKEPVQQPLPGLAVPQTTTPAAPAAPVTAQVAEQAGTPVAEPHQQRVEPRAAHSAQPDIPQLTAQQTNAPEAPSANGERLAMGAPEMVAAPAPVATRMTSPGQMDLRETRSALRDRLAAEYAPLTREARQVSSTDTTPMTNLEQMVRGVTGGLESRQSAVDVTTAPLQQAIRAESAQQPQSGRVPVLASDTQGVWVRDAEEVPERVLQQVSRMHANALRLQAGGATDFIQRLTLNLTPADLGQVEVNLRAADQVSITFTARDAATRDLLDAGIGRLRQMFEEQGISLGDVDVGGHTGDRAASDERDAAPYVERGVSVELDDHGSAPSVNDKPDDGLLHIIA